MELDNTIIYLIGIPAVGKYTVAKEIGRMTGAKVVDNQLINTPVFSVLGYDGTDAFPFPRGAWAQIEKIHRAVLAVIRDLCPPDASFVFTNTLDAREPLDKVWFRRIERLARQREAGFFPVWLTSEAEVIRQRKDTPDRRARLQSSPTAKHRIRANPSLSKRRVRYRAKSDRAPPWDTRGARTRA